MRSQTFPKERVTIIDYVEPLEKAWKNAWYDSKKMGISPKRVKDYDRLLCHHFLTNLLSILQNFSSSTPKVFGVYPYKGAIPLGIVSRLVSFAKKTGYPVCEFNRWGSPDMPAAGESALQKYPLNMANVKKYISRLGLVQIAKIAAKKKRFLNGEVNMQNANFDNPVGKNQE